MRSSLIVTVAAPLLWPTVNAAVNGLGTVKSLPAVALPPEAVNVTVVAALTAWSKVAVTVTPPESSSTAVSVRVTVIELGGGFSTVATTLPMVAPS